MSDPKLINEKQNRNPIGKNLDLIVELPESVNIKMVNADVLKDYEILWYVLTSLCSAFIAFFVALAQDAGIKINNLQDFHSFNVDFFHVDFLLALFNAILLGLIIVTLFFINRKKKKMCSKEMKTIKIKFSDDEIVDNRGVSTDASKLKYIYSNDLGIIEKEILKKTKIPINLHDVGWTSNPKIPTKVTDLMDIHNAAFYMTIFKKRPLRLIIVYKYVENKWSIYNHTIFYN